MTSEFRTKLPLAVVNVGIVLVMTFSFGCTRDGDSVSQALGNTEETSVHHSSEHPATETPSQAVDVPEDTSVPDAETPLIRGLQDMIGSSEVFDEQQDQLQQSLAEADRILSDVKRESLMALREANRQILIEPHPPNIILIVADDLGCGELSCYGQSALETPNLDRFASQGVRFTQFYAGGDTSSASWWCLMSGRYTAHYGRTRSLPESLDPEGITLAEVLWQAGYDTEFFGNWSLAGSRGDNLPHLHAFDHWAGTAFPADAIEVFPESIFVDGTVARIKANAGRRPVVSSQDFLTQEVLRRLERPRGSRPLFLVAAYAMPQRSADRSQPSGNRRVSAIKQLDSHLGRILDGLEEAGLEKRTLVFFTSDNSAEAADVSANSDRNGGLRGVKGELYEGGIRVPMIVRWPGRITGNTVAEQPAVIWDLFPTFADLAHASRVPKRLDGVSLVPMLSGGTMQARDRMYWQTSQANAAQAVRIGPWKAVKPAGKMDFADVELYNLEEDPSESRNVAAEHPDIVKRVVSLK